MIYLLGWEKDYRSKSPMFSKQFLLGSSPFALGDIPNIPPLIYILFELRENFKYKRTIIVKKEAQMYEISIDQTNRKGEFACPKCGRVISPKEKDPKKFSVEEDTFIKGIFKMMIYCGCGAEILLTADLNKIYGVKEILD